MRISDSGLFKIETNVQFDWVSCPKAEEQEKNQIEVIGKAYGFSPILGFSRMLKRNLDSVLYQIETAGGKYVFRGVDLSLSGTVEAQAKALHQTDYSPVIRPLKTVSGDLTVHANGNVWIAYAYREGELFSGKEKNLKGIIVAVLELLNRIKDIKEPVGTFCVCHRRGLWKSTLPEIISSGGFRRDPLAQLLSTETRQWVEERQEDLAGWIQAAAEIDPRREVALTHNDLNHANVLINDAGPFVLDIEDICYESPRIAAAHGIFKLLRHAVYTGHRTLEEIRNDLLPAVLDTAGRGFFGKEPRDVFFRYAQFRIFSDLQMILDKVLVQKVKRMPTDLEKKLMNLFELQLMVYGE